MSDWGRPHFVPGGGDATVFYVAFGPRLKKLELSTATYRTRGVPPGVEVANHDREGHPEIFRDLLGNPFAHFLEEQLPSLAAHVQEAPSATVVRGTVKDPPSLEYLRDTIGIVTAVLDQSIALLDPLALRWWAAPAWREEVFEPDEPSPQSHVAILKSEETATGTTWIHTRGMRKFGRPDLSIRGVAPVYEPAIHDLCDRFIDLQALGGMITEGAAVRMKELPEGMTCHHAGSLDDPDFNNVHVQVRWPD
ncbi:MAG: hypothetical protein ACAI25_15085 [Planctomycetota bacterium]